MQRMKQTEADEVTRLINREGWTRLCRRWHVGDLTLHRAINCAPMREATVRKLRGYLRNAKKTEGK